MHRLAMLVLLMVVAWLPAAAVTADDDPQALFAAAKNWYAAGQYDSTISLLKTFIRKNGKHPATEYLVPLLLEALSRRQDTDFSLKLTAIYVERYPASSFTPRVRYLEGVARARQGDQRGALGAFSHSLEAGLAPPLDSALMANVRFICETRLAADELAAFPGRESLHPRIGEIVDATAVIKLGQAGQTAKAERLGADFLQHWPRSAYSAEIKELVSRSRASQRGMVAVGLLAPLSGDDADVGRRIVQGVQMAVDAFNQSAAAKINLIILDTKSNMVETARRTRELLEEHRVPVIIGPMLSQEAVVTAAMVADKDVAMITPTATEDGIADLGQNIFQLNVTLSMLGRRIADYAMHNLNIREFAVIAPVSEYGATLSESFRAEVARNGGDIVSVETFEEGGNDFKAQFRDLRLTLAKRRWDRESTDPDYVSHRSAKADSVFLQDSSLSVGGIFIPAEAEDVVMLAPQVFFYKIKAQLLGATGWHNSKTILDGKQYVNNAVIATTIEPDKDEKAVADFRAQYQTRAGAEPDRVVALGYDAAELVCSALRSGDGTASARQIIKALQVVRQYQGMSGLISFDPARGANTEAAIVKISDKQFLRVQ